jgi:large conductance mechanosensitive channel
MGGFQKFLLRGNVVDLAVAVVIGTAFGAVVTAFTAAFLTPLIGLATGAAGDVGRRSFTAGGVVFPYGLFLAALLSFLLVAAVVYFVVVVPLGRLMDRYRTEPEPAAPVKSCPECLSKIPEAASRCAFCSAEQAAA